jgi:hypothetical protein
MRCVAGLVGKAPARLQSKAAEPDPENVASVEGRSECPAFKTHRVLGWRAPCLDARARAV